MRKLLTLISVTALLSIGSLPSYAQSVDNTSTNNNANQNLNESGANATGGESKNTNLIQGDSVDSESLVLQQIPGLNLQNIDQMIQNKLGVINCAVENAGGSEVRIGFPPAIVLKDQNVDGGLCMDALNMMSKYTQADVLSNISKYVDTLDLAPEYKEIYKTNLTNQILDLFILNREALANDTRPVVINRLQNELTAPKESWEVRSQKVLDEGKAKVKTDDVTSTIEVETEVEEEPIVKGGY